jgi:hypothetical protein
MCSNNSVFLSGNIKTLDFLNESLSALKTKVVHSVNVLFLIQIIQIFSLRRNLEVCSYPMRLSGRRFQFYSSYSFSLHFIKHKVNLIVYIYL